MESFRSLGCAFPGHCESWSLFSFMSRPSHAQLCTLTPSTMVHSLILGIQVTGPQGQTQNCESKKPLPFINCSSCLFARDAKLTNTVSWPVDFSRTGRAYGSYLIGPSILNSTLFGLGKLPNPQGWKAQIESKAEALELRCVVVSSSYPRKMHGLQI